MRILKMDDLIQLAELIKKRNLLEQELTTITVSQMFLVEDNLLLVYQRANP